MLRAAHEETRACDMHSLPSEPTHSRRTVEALWPALHSIHEVAAVLAGGRATPTTNSCAGNRDKAPRRKCSQFPELISSAAVAGTCRLHAIYMNQPCIYVGKVGETVKCGWARHPRRGTVGPTPRMQTYFCPLNMLTKPRQAAERSNCWPAEPLAARYPAGVLWLGCTFRSAGRLFR